jgi:hypothetical protein
MLVEICELRLNVVAVVANDPLLFTFVVFVLVPPLQPLFFFASNLFLLDLIGFRFLGEGGIDESVYKWTECELFRYGHTERYREYKKE